MGKNKIEVGEKAPLFDLESYNKGRVNLGELIGEKKIVLIFSRYFGCPICQLDLIKLLDNQDKIENKGAEILYITQSGKEVAEKVIAEKEINFPVIYSSKDELYSQYGLGMMNAKAVAKIPEKMKKVRELSIKHGEYEGWEKQGPGQFVIDEKGEIIHAKKGWLDLERLLKSL